MRTRPLKPSFFTNEDIASLPLAARILLQGLWAIADCRGLLFNRPMKIKAKIFPYDDSIAVNVEANLSLIASKKLAFFYEVEGKKCIQIPNFAKHARPHPNEKPDCDIPNPPWGLQEPPQQHTKTESPESTQADVAHTQPATMQNESRNVTSDAPNVTSGSLQITSDAPKGGTSCASFSSFSASSASSDLLVSQNSGQHATIESSDSLKARESASKIVDHYFAKCGRQGSRNKAIGIVQQLFQLHPMRTPDQLREAVDDYQRENAALGKNWFYSVDRFFSEMWQEYVDGQRSSTPLPVSAATPSTTNARASPSSPLIPTGEARRDIFLGKKK